VFIFQISTKFEIFEKWSFILERAVIQDFVRIVFKKCIYFHL